MSKFKLLVGHKNNLIKNTNMRFFNLFFLLYKKKKKNKITKSLEFKGLGTVDILKEKGISPKCFGSSIVFIFVDQIFTILNLWLGSPTK